MTAQTTRAVLGPADVSDNQLASIVAASLGARSARLVTCRAEVFPYDAEALTTGGRFKVSGTARTDESTHRPYAFFVKVIRSWSRSPLYHQLPQRLRTTATSLVPWRTEPDVYCSDLAACLPSGLTMPRSFAVHDLDEASAALWLAWVPARNISWDVLRYARAAYLLGRLAASRSVAPLAIAATSGRTPRSFASSWLAQIVLPVLANNELWTRPLAAAGFDEKLRARLLTAAQALPRFLNELDGIPIGTAHGDACTRNLLVTDDNDGFTLVDFGFWGRAPLGFDLDQLLLGEVQTGERPADMLPELEAACLPAYIDGLRAEGRDITPARARRAHALLMLIFSGLTAVPFEHLTAEPTADYYRVARERAAAARFILDLVETTSRHS